MSEDKHKFEELSEEAKEKAKDELIHMICANEIPVTLLFDESGHVIEANW